MTRTILFLRGVNVSGANRLPMAALCSLLADLGLQGARTYIQSGNAVFDDPGIADPGPAITRAIHLRFGFAPAAFLRDVPGFDAILRACPFVGEARADGSKVHLFLLSAPAPDLTSLAAFATTERLHITPQALYLHAPAGLGRSPFATKLGEMLKSTATARNFNTATAVLALANALNGTGQDRRA